MTTRQTKLPEGNEHRYHLQLTRPTTKLSKFEGMATYGCKKCSKSHARRTATAHSGSPL